MELQQIFNNPGRLLNLICRTKQLIMNQSISKLSMDIVNSAIAEVNGFNNQGQSEPQAITLLPSFLPILDYLQAVQCFYKDNINTQGINDQRDLANHLNQIVQDNHLAENDLKLQEQQSNVVNDQGQQFQDIQQIVRNQNELVESENRDQNKQLQNYSSTKSQQNNNNLRNSSYNNQDQMADTMINAQQQELQRNSDNKFQQFYTPINSNIINNNHHDTENTGTNSNINKNIISTKRQSKSIHTETQSIKKSIIEEQLYDKQNTTKTNIFTQNSLSNNPANKNPSNSTRTNLNTFTSFKAHTRSKTLLSSHSQINQTINNSNGGNKSNQFVKDIELNSQNERQIKINYNNSSTLDMTNSQQQQGRNNKTNDRHNNIHDQRLNPHKQHLETNYKNRLCQIMELKVRKPRVRSVVGGMIRGELSTASRWTESKLELSDLNRLHLREALSQLDSEVTMLQMTQSRIQFDETRQIRAVSQSDSRQKEIDDLIFKKQERDRLRAFQQDKKKQERQLLHEQQVSTIEMIRQSKSQSQRYQQYQKQKNEQNNNINNNADKSKNIYQAEVRIPTDISTWLHTSQGMNTERAERECWHNEVMKGSFEQSMSRLTGITNTTARGNSQNGTRQMRLYLEESSVYSENQMKDVISSIKASQQKHAELTHNLSHTLSLLKLNDQSRLSQLKNQ